MFQAVSLVLRNNQASFNILDTVNQNHGDHMVQIFDLATRSVQEIPRANLADAMEFAGRALQQIEHNGSARVYASGLISIAQYLGQRQITIDELVEFVRRTLKLSAVGGEQDAFPRIW